VKILLANEDPTILKAVTDLVEELGHEPLKAADGNQALEMMREGEAAMAVLDWELSGITGPEICRKLRSEDEERILYAVVLAPDSGSLDALSALNSGADDVLSLPLNAEELRARVSAGVRTVSLEQQLASLNRKLARMARTDSMTGLLNHSAVLAELDSELRRGSRKGTSTSVLMFDLDRFKAVNDTFGHQAGDEVLKRFARLIDTESRGYDKTGRYGGEEFLLLLPDTGPEECASIAERIRFQVEKMELDDIDPGLRVTTSVGGSTCDGSDIDGSRLIALADDALYRAKEAGRNRVCLGEG